MNYKPNKLIDLHGSIETAVGHTLSEQQLGRLESLWAHRLRIGQSLPRYLSKTNGLEQVIRGRLSPGNLSAAAWEQWTRQMPPGTAQIPGLKEDFGEVDQAAKAIESLCMNGYNRIAPLLLPAASKGKVLKLLGVLLIVAYRKGKASRA